MKTYKERTQDILVRAESQKKQRLRNRLLAAGALCMSAVLAFTLVLFVPYGTAMPSLSAYRDSEYYPLMQKINELTYTPSPYKNNFQKWFSGLFKAAAPEGDAGAGNEYGPAENGYAEVTDNQEKGVIEADLFKRTQTHVFYLDVAAAAPVLRVYAIAGEETEAVASYTLTAGENASFGGYTGRAELYLSADGRRVSILSPVWRDKSVYTAVIGVDVSDPLHPAEIGRTYLSGNYLTSRMVGGDILLINTLYIPKDPDFADQSQYLPQVGDESGMQSLPMQDILLPENANAARYTVVCRVDGADYAPEQTFACFSYSETAYVSQENIFLTHGYTATVQEGDEVTRTATTDISCLAYADGGLSLRGTATVKGSVKDQYSMDEENGILRVATSLNTNITASAGDGENMTDFISRRNAAVYCVRLSDFTIAGALESFAPAGEEVTAARFDGDLAYICTANIAAFTDPVYIIDLSDPADIAYKDTGIIAGFSSSLRRFKDGTLLGIGYGELSSVLKIEIYAETADSVESVACYAQENCRFSEQYKAYFIDADEGLIGLQLIDYYKGTAEYLLLRFDGYSLNVLSRTDIGGEPDYARATLIDGFFYIFNGGQVRVAALS